VLPGSRLTQGRPGPGIEVTTHLASRPAPPTLHVAAVPFTVTAEHDLLRRHEIFGLTRAGDTGQGHFPGISGPYPLAVERAAQAATASFSAVGFKAAAVTAIAAMAGGAPVCRYRTTRVHVTFDRPFGFLAVHRRTGMVLAAGWVDDVRNSG
jgi:serine protease inhibitor